MPRCLRPTGPGRCRRDPFSTYRPGFEVRTYRRCHRVLMFHHFPDEPGVGADCLVCSTDLSYASTGGSGMTTVASVTHTGYRRRRRRLPAASLPPLEFRYSQAVIGTEVRDLSPDALENLPAGIDGTAYQWVDLDGEGLSGVLARQGGAWFYKANLGDGRFAPERSARHPARDGRGAGRGSNCSTWPATATWTWPSSAARCRVSTSGRDDRGWQPFRPFRSCAEHLLGRP